MALAILKKEKRAVLSGFMWLSIISICKKGQEVIPVFVVVGRVNGENIGQCLFHLLGETIRLSMVRRRVMILHFIEAKGL